MNIENAKTQAEKVFEEWSNLNDIICDWRSRFDGMREGLEKLEQEGALNKKMFKILLIREEYDTRYPQIPDILTD